MQVWLAIESEFISPPPPLALDRFLVNRTDPLPVLHLTELIYLEGPDLGTLFQSVNEVPMNRNPFQLSSLMSAGAIKISLWESSTCLLVTDMSSLRLASV